MSGLGFEWDDKKEKANIKKHDIPFDEAIAIFYDENAIQFLIRIIQGDKIVSSFLG